MNILFFVIFPIAVILISIVLQKLLKSPLLVAILIFAIFLILAYTVFTPEFLLNAIIYAIIAFITAAIFKLICCLRRRIHCNIFNVCDDSDNCSCNNDNDDDNDFGTSIANLEDSIETINNNMNRLTRLLSSVINNGNNNCGCNNNSNNNCCCCNRRLRR